MDQTILHKYNNTYGVRFTKRQKAKFRAAMIEDFGKLGYEHTLMSGRKHITKVNNLLFGSIRHAKTILAIPYDTPQRLFWLKNRFYPLNGAASANHSILPLLAPALLFYLFMLVMMNQSSAFIHDQISATIMLVLLLSGFLFLMYFMLHGIANRRNSNRYSAAVALALELAQTLNKDQRRTTAFLFLDSNQTRFYGSRLASEKLQKQNKNPNVILLSSFACGSQMCVGYSTQAKKLAQEIVRSQSDKRLTAIALNDDMRNATPAEPFTKSVILAAGEWDNKKRLCVFGTASGKDRYVNESNYDAIAQALRAYLTQGK